MRWPRRSPPGARRRRCRCRPGVTTDEVDRVVHEYRSSTAPTRPRWATGVPKSCCTSLNEVICHGIPDTTVMRTATS